MIAPHHSESYKKQIMKHLRNGETLDGIKALNLFGCWCLPQRISELRKAGEPIAGRWATSETGKRYMVYYLPTATPATE